MTILRLVIAMICIVRMPTQIGVCRIDGGLDVIAGDGTIYEVSKWGGSDGTDGAGAWVILVSIWRWVLQEGAERSKVPSEKVVVILDRADVHRVAGVTFMMRTDGPVRLCRERVSGEKDGRGGRKVGYHVSRTVAPAVHVRPIAMSERCHGRKTRLRASSFNDARVGRGGQPLGKTQLRSELFFPNATGTARDRALGIEGSKRVGGREGGISCWVRVTFEFVGGVSWWAGVWWDGDWHLAKEGLELFVSQAATAVPLGP